MEFAKTRVQLRQEKGIPTPRNPFLVVTNVYQKEGLRALYKGCGALVVVSLFLSKSSIPFYQFSFFVGCPTLDMFSCRMYIPGYTRPISLSAVVQILHISECILGFNSERRCSISLL